MTIALTQEQRRWLEDAVAAGKFATVEEGLEAALVGLLTDVDAEDELVAPLLDEARAGVAAGESMSLPAFKHHLAHRRLGTGRTE